MTTQAKELLDIKGISAEILARMPFPVTIIDPAGIILDYNETAARLLDRKPDYIGRDVRFCHERKESVDKIDQMLEEFGQGRERESGYETVRNGRKIKVVFFPVRVREKLKALVQVVLMVDEI